MLATPNRFFGASFMKLEMPALSPTMSEGTIVKWNIKEGGKVSVGDVICEIQTDKATVGFESQEEGYIAKILSDDGSTKVCGGLIGIMVDKGLLNYEEKICKYWPEFGKNGKENITLK